MSPIELPSRVREVVVYARGAIVQREVALPHDLPGETCELVLPCITAQSEGGSLRATVDVARDVVALRSRIQHAPGPVSPADVTGRLRALELERRRLDEERSQLISWRDEVASIGPAPDLTTRTGHPDLVARTLDFLALDALSRETAATLEARLEELNDALEANAKAQERVRLEAAQANTRDRGIAVKPTREVLVRLGARTGEAKAGTLVVTYAIAAARWWPAYTARLTKGGARVDWAVEAFVAQASDEDWSGVKLALATADRIQDVRLPELPSLRWGRAQPKTKRGYRPPPQGLDELFAGYDRFRTSVPGRKQQAISPPPPPPPLPPPPAPSMVFEQAASAEALFDDAEYTPPPMEKKKAAAPPRAAQRTAMIMAPSSMPAPSAAPRRERMAKEDALEGFGGGPPGAPPPEPPPPPEPEVTEDWLDFDHLQLPNGDQHGRGKLQREARAETNVAYAVSAVERLPPPPHARDPRDSRGNFDHRYDASGPCDVPSDTLPHRVTLLTAGCDAKAKLVSVPRESDDVFRSSEIVNPLGTPLLTGPVDVYMEGSLLATSTLLRTDIGGKIALGLGVEDRVKVARNVRASEESAGLLGGQLSVQHDVSIEISSNLGFPAKIEVIDRVPVTKDDDLTIALGTAKPAFEKYAQDERDAPVKGGLRWTLELAPGGRAKIDYGYKLAFSNKQEVVGGNRRD